MRKKNYADIRVMARVNEFGNHLAGLEARMDRLERFVDGGMPAGFQKLHSYIESRFIEFTFEVENLLEHFRKENGHAPIRGFSRRVEERHRRENARARRRKQAEAQ